MKEPLFSQWSLRNRLLLATVVVAAIGIGASDFAAHAKLRGFLIRQVDSQLSSVADGTVTRLVRAGIAPASDDSTMTTSGTPSSSSPYSSNAAPEFHPVSPLRGVPTATSVTLLDPTGVVLGQLGGDIASGGSQATFSGMTLKEVASTKGKAFTIETDHPHTSTRAMAFVLPSNLGSVVVSVSLNSVDRTLHELSWLFLLISLIVLLLIGLISRWLITLSLKPLLEVEVTAAAIADGDLSARLPELQPSTEVGRLTQSLNTMLGRIEESFEQKNASESKLRRFVADASHELRTPLTAIRGFAELHRQGAVTGEVKVKELVGRIEKESIRMGSLVEDLLLLARMDEARPHALEPVDLTHLIGESVASARAAGPEHPITLDVADDLYVLGDNKRIHQAVGNLLANARTHTPAGTAITITANSNESETTVSVSDAGPGLSEQDQSRIFERFFRVDPSRARHAGEGSGLGLSIVDAVMKAHGGRVSVESELGKGATFTLHFPINSLE
jgi:two-component system OmpR family sensor kinase